MFNVPEFHFSEVYFFQNWYFSRMWSPTNCQTNSISTKVVSTRICEKKLYSFQASCDFNSAGLGGNTQSMNGFCILSQNIINQKMYIVLWFWYILILSFGIVQLLKEAVIIAVPAFRNRLITRNMGSYVTTVIY